LGQAADLVRTALERAPIRRLACAAALVTSVALAGCGSSGSNTTSTRVIPTPSTATVPGPSGPIVRVCDRALAREVVRALRGDGFRGKVPAPAPAGTQRLSSCDLGKLVEISMDAAPDAVQRYQNRIAESAQFAVDRKHFQPQPVSGVGAKSLGGAGANWLPWLNQLLSARGKRVLIVAVNTEKLPQAQRLAAAKAISLAAWGRLG
jgi:hypothetical protein